MAATKYINGNCNDPIASMKAVQSCQNEQKFIADFVLV